MESNANWAAPADRRGVVVVVRPWASLKGAFFRLEGDPQEYFVQGRVILVGLAVSFDLLDDGPVMAGARQAFNLRRGI